MLNRPQIKSEARQLLRTAVVSPLLMTAAVLFILFILGRISDLVEYGSLFYSYTNSAEYMDALMRGDLTSLPELAGAASGEALLSPMSLFFTVLVNLFTIVLYGGYYAYCIGIRRGLQMPFWTLLDGLSISGKLIWCSIQMTVKTFLWSMLFLIPGMIASYRYRFAYYNIVANPNLSASEAIALSCRQTSGMKGQLFLLDLSFLGWVVLPVLLSNILSWLGLYPLAIVASIAVQVWTTPYMMLCDLAYFDAGQSRAGPPPVM